MTDNVERVHFDPPSGAEDTWWGRYAAELGQMTSTARGALRTDCAYIVERGLLGAGSPDVATWPQSRTRTGLVMGSVQSGKTASMFGVTALALDHGIDIVVILAGTRLSLWRQTYERMVEQLDAGEEGVAKARRRLLCPAPGVVLGGASGTLDGTYRLPSAQVRRKLTQKQPLIVVAMKQTDHLYALGRELRQSVFGEVAQLDRAVHMLVLDDEADDGSVLDAVVEQSLSPLSPALKQVPRAIADLWEPRSSGAPDNLFATYIGYTATPQANLLQEDHNPLAPRDFVISLRTPLDVGIPAQPADPNAPRSSTYPEPNGINSYYTGGEVYYARGAKAGLCLELAGEPDDDLADSIRAFLIAGAIRLHWASTNTPALMGPHSIRGVDFALRDDVRAVSPPTQSMLIHPSADIGAHFATAEDVLVWAGAPDRAAARNLLTSGNAQLPLDLIAKMRSEEALWEIWIDRYQASSTAIATEFNVMNPRPVPTWPTVRAILEAEVIPGTRVSVVNSDAEADDRPEYKPIFDEAAQRWRAAPDLSTIFVSGNVMARGLTLEGMTTALFRRTSANPFADTQMQMQRWFGYRGEYIELCRVFATRQQIELFGAYHDVDEALRQGIAARMAGDAPSPVVLHGMSFLATGKIANVGRVPLCPGAKPFITLINGGQTPDPNERLVAELFAEPSVDVSVGRATRGRALDRTLSLSEAADLLDSFSFESYAPGNDSRLAELWQQVRARVDATLTLPPGTRFYNAPNPTSGTASDARFECPYAIAAYLRLWEASLTRAVPGLFVTGVPSGRWALADLSAKQLHQPRFSVGIRYGDGESITDGALAGLGFNIRATRKALNAGGDLDTTWGSNDPNAGPLDYRGDEFFDYYHRGEVLPATARTTPWRPQGSHGQILFYINKRPRQPHPVVAVGVCIPAGGPEQFAATRAGSLIAA
ncbi:Z1 domain-containing protein [Microbacterium jiangjiandongii]|uniref:Z1 domain-containing protein n=1 Tax=Microbacterium jiangjiandongii TaxID=3049071 RepID=UPI00214D0ED4|nr:Z1 domain-containing protein [Microbacterium sp. zg.Y843]MCR2816579.1 Z1 domain-containing protein [Microbacterium sp. zg.Y843]